MDLFALPILAAEGLAWLVDARSARRRRPASRVAGACSVVAGAALVAACLSRGGRLPPPVLAARARLRAPGAGRRRRRARWSALLVGGVVRPPVATLALALVSLVDLVTISRGYVQPKPSDWAAGTERFAAVDWLLAQAHRRCPTASSPTGAARSACTTSA